MATEFGRWLDITMGNRKMSGSELAQKLGVIDSTVSRWRRSQGVPTIENCMAIAEIFEVDPLRLAVTAGLLEARLVNAEPLPIPEEVEDRDLARQHIMKIPGLTGESRRRLLETFDQM